MLGCMTGAEKRLRVRRTRQGIVIVSVVGSAGLASALGVSAAQAEGDDSQTGTVVNQVSPGDDSSDDSWGAPPPMAQGSGASHAASRGS
jgi:hypothetical protein